MRKESGKGTKKTTATKKSVTLSKAERALIEVARGASVGELVRDRETLDLFQEVLDKLRVAI